VLSVQLDGEEILTRPTKFSAKFDFQVWGVKPSTITHVVDEMKKKTMLSKMMCWVLQKAIKGVSMSQNADRDFTPIAQAVMVEARMVSQYRRNILNLSDSAMWLREEKQGIVIKAQKSKKQVYKYLNGIMPNEEVDEEPDVDLLTIVETTRIKRVYREEKKQVASLLTHIRESGVSQATCKKAVVEGVIRLITQG
jgi:hypothetical protein